MTARPEARTLSPEEAAEIIGCCSKTLGRFRDAGAIKAINLGTGPKRATWRYHPDDVQAFLETRRRAVELPCPSTSRKAPLSGTSTSESNVVAIMDRLERATGGKLSGSNDRPGKRRSWTLRGGKLPKKRP